MNADKISKKSIVSIAHKQYDIDLNFNLSHKKKLNYTPVTLSDTTGIHAILKTKYISFF